MPIPLKFLFRVESDRSTIVSTMKDNLKQKSHEFLFVFLLQSIYVLFLKTYFRISSSHNSNVVENIIKAIGTDKYSEGLIRSKMNICSQSNLHYYLKFSK